MDQVNEVGRKIVVGLRQVAAESTDTLADRLNGYATELAHEIGYKEPVVSANLLAAREMAATAMLTAKKLGRPAYAVLYTITGREIVRGSVSYIADVLRRGSGDDSINVVSRLEAIEKGRELAAEGAAAARINGAPDRLTITIDGPQGSGKTRCAEWLARHIGVSLFHPGASIVEMRDGRPFDVRGDVFLDGREG